MDDFVLNISNEPIKINKSKPKSETKDKKDYLNRKRNKSENTNKRSDDNDKKFKDRRPNRFNMNSEDKKTKPQIKIKPKSENIRDLSNIQLPDIELKKDTDYNPFSAKLFTDLKLNPYLLKNLTKQGYDQLTKIQKQAIPILLEHKNVVVKSETGTGKTLAYVVPLYEHLIKQNEISKINRKDGVYAIIFAPTHELCLQIEHTLTKLNSCCIGIVNGTLIGGQKIDIEKSKIRKGINIIVCTPGRLLYHLNNSGNLIFNKLSHIIFDEADVLLDMGFEKDIKECLKKISESVNKKEFTEVEAFKKFKIFLLSATIDYKIRGMTSFLMKGFKSVGFKSDKGKEEKNEKGENIEKDDKDEIENLPSNLRQFYSLVYDEYRLIHLISFLYTRQANKVIIFINNCDSVDFHKDLLINLKLAEKQLFDNCKILAIHGKMKHDERLKVFKEFNSTNKNIFLFATDVIARGLDFPNVEWIIHYDINPNKKDYLNRMGRTARLTSSGNSLLFLMEHEMKLLETNLSTFTMEKLEAESMLLRFIKEFNETLKEENKLPLNSMDWKTEIDINEQYRKKHSFVIFPLINSIKEYLHSEDTRVASARKAFKCSLRAYTTYRKYANEVFNLNVIHLTRYARAFGLYKESLKYKFDDIEYRVDQRSEKNKTKSEKKFYRAQKKAEISEFM